MTGAGRLPPAVRDSVEAFATAVGAACPGLLAHLHVTGSATTGDWHPEHSDIDVVAVTTRPVGLAELDPLTLIHAATQDSHRVDGIWLTEEQLAAGPDTVDAAPQAVDGVLTDLQPGGRLSWVTWLELQDSPTVTPTADGGLVWGAPLPPPVDRAGVAAYCRANLATYWAKTVGDANEPYLANLAPDQPLDADGVTWTVLGPPRLLATLRTGRIVSKSEAGRYAAQIWPEHAALVRRAVASRAGADEAFTVADGREALALLRKVLAAGT